MNIVTTDTKLDLFNPRDRARVLSVQNQLTTSQQYMLLSAIIEAIQDITGCVINKDYELMQPDTMTRTQRNYASSIRMFMQWQADTDQHNFDKTTIERFKEDLLNGHNVAQVYKHTSVNAKLSAIRAVLKLAYDKVHDDQLERLLLKWSSASNAKPEKQNTDDETTRDTGTRLTLNEVEHLIKSLDTDTVKGLRDRAIVALMVGFGLRVSEVPTLTIRDVLYSTNKDGQHCVYVSNGKGNKTRSIPYDKGNNWAIKIVAQYIAGLDIEPMNPKTIDNPFFFAIRKGDNVTSDVITTRGIMRVIADLPPVKRFTMPVQVKPHDLRRTYATLSIDSGMSWESLRDNLGHSDLKTTQRYVGMTNDWSKRFARWTIKTD